MESAESVTRSLKRVLPGKMLNFLRACRYRGCLGHLDYLYKKKRYEKTHKLLNEGLSPEKITVLPGITLSIPNTNVRHAFNHFTYLEPEMVDEMKAFVRVMKGATTLLDVGALYGIFSLVFTGRPHAASYALEPNPISMSVLKQNIALNPTHNVTPFQIAAGDAKGRLDFVDDGMHLVATADKNRSNPSNAKKVSIDVITLDSFCDSNNLRPDIIKIDVEGFEYQVLKGCEQTLTRSQPVLFIEIHPDLLAKHDVSAPKIMEFLLDKGYKFYDQNLVKVGARQFASDRVFRVICACDGVGFDLTTSNKCASRCEESI
jgi:FkbM family methyltransferase